MARDVRGWIAVALGACGVIAVAFVPPRGGVAPPRARVFAIPDPTPARLRAQTLAAEWRALDATVRLLEQRTRIHAERARSSPDDRRWGPKVVLTGATPSPGALLSITATMDSVWRTLGLEETKIRVVVVIQVTPSAQAAGAAPTLEGPVYLEPDSTDRTTCVALIPAGPYWTRVILGEAIPERWRGHFVRWLRSGLGPCAFYATYGAPGRPVRRWLAARRWDIGLFMTVDSGPASEAPSFFLGDPRFAWYWERIYSFPTATVACLAGRPDGCRSAVLRGATGGSDSLPRTIRLDRGWWRTEDLIPVERYLSDVAGTVGRDRFLEFWSSTQPVDTALALALRKPVGEWTAAWQRTYVPRLRLGAAAPFGAYVLALAFGALALMTVALTASRRQLR